MADSTDLDLAVAVALAESSQAFSDDDFKPPVRKAGHTQQLAFDACRTLTKKPQQQSKKKVDKEENEKGSRHVEEFSGDGGRLKKVRKQVAKKEVIPRQHSTVKDSNKPTPSLSLPEFDSFRYTGSGLGNSRALGEAVPIFDKELEAVEDLRISLDSPKETQCSDQLVAEDFGGCNGTGADHMEECLVIDIDTDEVVELCDETQFSVLLRLCGEECEQDELRTEVVDVGRVPTVGNGALVNSVVALEQSSTVVANKGGCQRSDSVENFESTAVKVLSTNLTKTVLEGTVGRESRAEPAVALSTTIDETHRPVVELANDVEERNSPDQFCEDLISSMMTQKCVSQPDEVKIPQRTSPSPLQNISNLPARVRTNKQRVNVRSLNQEAKRMELKHMSGEDSLDKGETGPLRASVLEGSCQDHCQNKENVGASPVGAVVVEHSSVSGNAMERSVCSDGHEPGREDVFWSGEVRVTITCPVCGDNISGITVEERLAHTNSCLDNLDNVQGCPQDEEYRNGPTLVPASDQVKDWLEKLNLSRYVSLFVEQEIDWDTIPWLTEEDLLVMGIIAIGPRRKIFQAIQELKRGGSGGGTEPQSVPAAPSPAVENASTGQIPILPASSVSRIPQANNGGDSNNLITNYFPLPLDSGKKQLHDQSETNSVHRTGVVKSKISKRPRSSVYQNNFGIPSWMCIPGTPFRVDAFQHLSGGCSHWFLTHFHTDHYQGLTRGFRYGHIFCSSITARLVNLRIGVSWEKLMIIPLHEKVKIAGVDVTFIDANHCPGSVMILFEPPNGEAVLHTGDFRFCPEMANDCILQTVNIHTLILDTTYCDPQYDFPTQDTVIRFVIEAIQAEMFNADTLFLIGTYTIGKERIFLEVAKVLKKYVYVGAPKQKLLDCMDLAAEDTRWLTCNEQESFIHVVPLWSISSFKRMNSIARHYQGRYKLIVAFSPTGWSFGRGKKKTPGKRWKQGTMIRYEVPYSEHCSFSELREFLRFVGPEDIIPSVPDKNGVGTDAMIASLWSEDQQSL